MSTESAGPAAPSVPLKSATCTDESHAICYDVQIVAGNLGPVTALTPIPDGRVMFIEDRRQIRIVAHDTLSISLALPAELGRQLTGLTIDPQFERSRSVFVAWAELARGADGLNITRYREVEGALGEGANIATALPIAPNALTPLAVDDDGFLYVAVPGGRGASFLNGAGVVMRFDRHGLVPRSNQNASPIVAEGYPVPLVLTIDGSNRKVWLSGRDHARLGAISAFDLRDVNRGTWPSQPVAVDGIDVGDEQIESVAIAAPVEATDDMQLLLTMAGRLRKLSLTPRRTVVNVSEIPVGNSDFVHNVATARDGSLYISVTSVAGSTSILKLTRVS